MSNLHTGALQVIIFLATFFGGFALVMGGGSWLLDRFTTGMSDEGKKWAERIAIPLLIASFFVLVFLVISALDKVNLGKVKTLYIMEPEGRHAERRVAALFERRMSGKGGTKYAWFVQTVFARDGEKLGTAKLGGGRSSSLTRTRRDAIMRGSSRKQTVFVDLYSGRRLGSGDEMMEHHPKLRRATWRKIADDGWNMRAQLQSGEEVEVSPSIIAKHPPMTIQVVSAKTGCNGYPINKSRGEKDGPKGLLRVSSVTRSPGSWRRRHHRDECVFKLGKAAGGGEAKVVLHRSTAFGEGDYLLSVMRGDDAVRTIELNRSLGDLFHEQFVLWDVQIEEDTLRAYLIRNRRSVVYVSWKLSDQSPPTTTLLF